MENVIKRTLSTDSVFETHFLNSKGLFMYFFNNIPSIMSINYIDGEKVFYAVKEQYSSIIRSVYEYREFDGSGKNCDFDRTLMVLDNECVIDFYRGYCDILHNYPSAAFAKDIVALAKPFTERRKLKPREINLVVRYGNCLDIKSMEISKTKLDLDLFFEDDFKEIDAVIRKRLNQKRDKGIILLHGLPGTGKTTYLRYLASKIKKRILFLSANLAGNLLEPEFIELLIDNPDSVLIVEDAENLIMDRKANANSAVSGLLNISDGLLADFLNVQLICTFNNSLTMVDSALLRKGRLIAKYEFGRLSIIKAQRLSDHLGFASVITKPMTVAEIANQNEKTTIERIEVIGFKVRQVSAC